MTPEATPYQLEKWRRLLLLRDSRVVYVVPGTEKLVRSPICVLCGPSVGYRAHQLQAHHIRPKSLFPDLALRLSNGVMLCAGHHQGIVHNHNATVDVSRVDYEAGWAAFVVHFRRWNELAEQARFNQLRQVELTGA